MFAGYLEDMMKPLVKTNHSVVAGNESLGILVANGHQY
jgi:hypothetical protein